MANLFVGNDCDVYLQGYILASTNAPVTDAQPSFTVYYNVGPNVAGQQIQGSAVSGLTGVSMSPMVSGTSGDYRGKIPGTAGLNVNVWYFIVVTFANYNDMFSGWFQATARTGS
jgi:hypothetical protein